MQAVGGHDKLKSKGEGGGGERNTLAFLRRCIRLSCGYSLFPS